MAVLLAPGCGGSETTTSTGAPRRATALECRGAGTPIVVLASGATTSAAVMPRAARGVPRPFVVVGASFGSLVAQLRRPPPGTGSPGLVLVDSLHPDLDRTFKRLVGRPRRGPGRARWPPTPRA